MYCYVSLTIQLNISHLFTQLNNKTVLFLAIQFSISHLITQFESQTFLFCPLIGPYQVVPLRARVDLETMAMKGYSTFPKTLVLLEPHPHIV